MRDFVVDASTTGKDLVDRLSEEEVACIKAAVGDAVFTLLQSVPLLSAGTDAASAAPLFNCLTQENVVLLGAAFIDAQAGGRSPETRECIADLSLQHPEVIYLRLGLQREGEQTVPAAQTDNVILQFLNCLTDVERVEYLVRLYSALDGASLLTGTDIIALLPESEEACVREGLSADQYNTLLASTPLQAALIAAPVAACLGGESVASLLVASTAGAIGEIADESASCMREFIGERPDYVLLLAASMTDASSVSSSEFIEIGSSGLELMSCLTDEELSGVLELVSTLLGS